MKRHIVSLLCLVAFLAVLPGQIFAQVPEFIASGKYFQAVRTETPPIIDGLIDDAVWQNAAFIDDLHQITPVEFAEPSERTEIYVLYDQDALYIAARLFIDPEKITANILRRGGVVFSDDSFAVNLGPFNDQRSGYFFAVNPNGVRYDGIFRNVSEPFPDWDSIFYVETSRFEDGWIAEYSIPFKSISFNENSDTWGINFYRGIRDQNEAIGWQSFDRRFDPSTYGQMIGLENLNQGMGLDVTPSVSLGGDRSFNPAGSDSKFEPSLDLAYKITPSLNGFLTFNTDFSATEIDNRQVNLTRFSLFFPEKRDFFLRDADIFEFGLIGSRRTGLGTGQNGRPFFSRNIGLGIKGEPVDLDYGAKVSGRIGNLDIGALSILQDQQPGVDASTLSVARASMGVLSESSVGFILTDGNPRSNLDNTLLGVDYLYRNSNLSQGRILEISGWYQESDTEGVTDNESATGIGFSMPSSTGFSGGASVKRFESNFNPALGFVNRLGVRDIAADLDYTYRPEAGIWQSYAFNLGVRRYDFIDGGLQSQRVTIDPYRLSSRSGDLMFWRSNFIKDVLAKPFEISPGVIIPAGKYSFKDHGIEFQSAARREFSANFTYIWGPFYTGDLDRYFGKVAWKPSAKFSANIGYDIRYIDLPEGEFTTRIITAGIDYIFSSNLSWVNLIQYDNVTETLGINMRLHWVPEEGQEFFFVINQIMEDHDGDNSFHSAFTDVTAKLSYTFRY